VAPLQRRVRTRRLTVRTSFRTSRPTCEEPTPNMPAMARKNFPKEGHVLYESDDDLSVLLDGAGFKSVRFIIKGRSEAPEGRLALATK